MRTVYFSIFDSHLRYGSQVWGQNRNQQIKEIEKLQQKALRIINFKSRHDEVTHLFENSNIMRFKDMMTLSNCLFVFDHIKELLPQTFNDYFKTAKKQHNYNTRGSRNQHIIKPVVRTTQYGLNSVIYKSATSWNLLVNQININDETLTKRKFIKLLKEKISSNYNEQN